MKCDVCQTKIPLGSNRCPNCGYIVRSNHANTYDATGKTHQHIQTKSISKRIKPILDKPINQNNKTKLIYIFTFIIAIILIFGIVFQVVFYENNFFSDYLYNVEQEEMIDDFDILDNEAELVTCLENHGFENIEVNHTASEDNQRTTTTTEGYKDGSYFTITFSYDNKHLRHTEFVISGSYDGELNWKTLPVNKEDIEKIGDFLQIDDVYNIIYDYRLKMEKKDNEYQFITDDIYLIEKYYEENNPYCYFYYSIEKSF